MRTTEKRNELVERNLGLVAHPVKKYNFGKYDDDLFKTGCIGLIKAADTFDETRGIKFSTYAIKCISTELFNATSGDKSKARKIRENEVSGDVPNEITGLTLFDMLGGETDFAEETADKETIRHILSSLTEREKNIPALWASFKTHQEVGDCMGFSKSNASRILKRIFEKIRAKAKKMTV